MARRTQTTVTFDGMLCRVEAEAFVSWLKTNINDRDCGFPILVDSRPVDAFAWCVEYSYDSTWGRYLSGVIAGIRWGVGRLTGATGLSQMAGLTP